MLALFWRTEIIVVVGFWSERKSLSYYSRSWQSLEFRGRAISIILLSDSLYFSFTELGHLDNSSLLSLVDNLKFIPHFAFCMQAIWGSHKDSSITVFRRKKVWSRGGEEFWVCDGR
jgi:hypothetical protein